jgi:hypothetical protein
MNIKIEFNSIFGIVSSKSAPNNSRSSVKAEALRFEDLLSRFKRNKLLSKQNEVLELLLSLSGD